MPVSDCITPFLRCPSSVPPCNRHPHLLSVLVRARCSLLIVHCSSHNFQGCCSPSRSSQDPLGSVRPNRAGALNILIPQRSLMVRGRHVSRPSTPHHTHTFHIHTLFFLSFTPKPPNFRPVSLVTRHFDIRIVLRSSLSLPFSSSSLLLSPSSKID